MRVATERRRAFRGGVWLVELTDLRDPEFLDRVVAAAVGLPERPGQPLLDTLIDCLGAEQVLLLLDNCEHLLNACAEIATRLLRACPGLRILATSREPLNVAGEMTLTVPPLELPERQILPPPAALSQFAAVSLFVDRAVTVAPTFRLTCDNHAAVAEVCHRLDGLPLAIELAAARLRVLTPEQLLERLTHPYRPVVRVRPGGVEPRPPLRASLDWSFALCTGQEQRLWTRLAVFAGGFELDAVEAICSDEAVPAEAMLDLVAGLMDKSILYREEYQYGVRYRMLESFREYAVEKLADGNELPELARRHRDWHQQLLGRVNAEWISRRQEYWLERLPLEHANLRAALDSCRTAPAGAEVALQILLAIPSAYLWARDLLGEARCWLEQALSAHIEPSPLRARALLLAAQLAVSQGELDGATRLLTEGKELAERFGDPAALARAGYVCAQTALYAGDLPAAMTLFTEALTACDPLATPNQRLDILLAFAVAAGLADDERRAVSCHEQIVALTEPVNERFSRSNSLWVLGLTAWRQGDHERSARLQRQALRLKSEIDDPSGTALSLEALAAAHVPVNPERAATLLGAAEAVWQAGCARPEAQQYLLCHYHECVQLTREQLGKSVYDKAFRRGFELSAEDAVGYALDDAWPISAPGPLPVVSGPTNLTRRERQVADLIGRGLSNKDIAGALVIAQRTAEGHVENILAKLGFRSRSQVASWVAREQTES